MRGLLVSSFASATGAAKTVGAAGAWSLTFSIQVRINSWKKSLFGVGVGIGADSGLGAGALMAGLPRQTRGIVERWRWSGERRRSREGR